MKNEKIIIALILGLAILGFALINRQTKLDTIKEQSRIEIEQIDIEREATLKQEEQTEKEELERQSKLTSCLTSAAISKMALWLRNCENHGYNIERDEDGEITNCSLSFENINRINAEEQKEKDRCAEIYK